MRGSSSQFTFLSHIRFSQNDIKYSTILCLCLMQKVLPQPFLSSSPPSIVFGWTGKSSFHIFLQLQLYAHVNGIGVTNIICRMLSTFKSCLLEITIMMAWSEIIYNLSLEPLKTYLHCHNIYIHQTWHGDDLPLGTPTSQVTWSFDHVVCWTMWQTKVVSLLLE